MPDLLLWILASLGLLTGVGWVFLLFYNARELSSYANFALSGTSTNNEEVVSVVIPARNEEMMITRCLKSIAGQTHRNLEFVVVDDRSTDGTAELAASVVEGDGRGRMVHGEELPDGWVGKNWACHQGFRVSRGEWLLFVDSDSILARDAVERTLSHAKRNGKDALSVFPRGELRGFWAKMVWPVLASVIRLLYPLRSVNDSKGRRAVLFGAFILIKREAYERIGGHEAVRGDFVEDKQMANNLKAKGVPFGVLLDGAVLTAGLAGGFTAVWSSIKRIASNPLRERKLAGFGFVLTGLMLFVFPLLSLGVSAVSGTATTFFIIAAAISVLSPAAIVTYDVRNTTSRSYGFTLLAFAAGTLIMLGILRQLVGGASFTWRGRTYKPPDGGMAEMGTGGLLLRRLRAKVSDIPTNFSWVYGGKVAASGIPSSRDQVEWLARHGVNSVLTLTEAPLPAEWFEGMNIRVRHLPMKDHEVPPVGSLDEAASYIDQEVKSGRTVLVHCLAGKGRTGSALAAYLMKTKRMSAKEASELLRKMRPGSVESRQETSLREYEKSLKGP